ncbi:RNA polymerase factor sigma-54 [Coralloluteibacterium stylophorae]|uniref:RNA polymerase sigma-54 factor n=1 Tax=Coralloluteibacterium stylophorae TaxID=1776034 RepID=A0A8J8AZ16_9GAMM|nr:RNA polymerase factor sigma-54 [Coralloluteibacterium stylophorae]MBS7456740.1 RNA polymerase factor sigma-54 [Coralloluteibacterium stylophorae]
MKVSLQTRLGQQLTLTPQLRQAIRLLQLSAVELELELTAALESNPLLERPEDAEPEPEPEPQVPGTDGSEAVASPPEAEAESEAEPPLDYEPDWGETSEGPRGSREDGEDYGAGTIEPDSLHDHLLWQLHLSSLSPRDRAIGAALIEAIGDDGYLGEPLEALQEGLRPAIDAGLDEIGAVLSVVQHLDPVGVGARDLAECLCIQLGVLAPETPGLALARTLAREHLEALAKLGAERLAVQLRANPAEMATAIALLRSLDPRPGAQVSAAATEYIAPDCMAYRQNGLWRVALAPGQQPTLGINRHYEQLIAKSTREDASYLRGQLQEARWLIKSLETRADTLLRVARCIVHQQAAFLDHGDEAMRPLTLREVAEEVGLHESTVSRATSRKYLLTPRGTFEFKHFFSSGIATDTGGAASATAIQAMIRKLVEAEDPRKPLSDARLADALKAAGVPVARRTVAKYREAIHIPSSNERQRLD